MISQSGTRPVLARLAAAAVLTIALPSVSAYAQKTKGTDEPAVSESSFNVRVSEVETTRSTLDADAIQDILTGGSAADYADELANLDAERITIPEIVISYETIVDGETTSGEFSYLDIVIENIVDGVAGSVEVGSAELTDSKGSDGSFGALTASDFNIGALLAFYGMVEMRSDEFVTIYRDFAFEGGTLGSDDFSCEFGAIQTAEFNARPISTPFADFMNMAAALEAAGDEPSPAEVAAFIRAYADIITAFRSSPITMDGFSCEGQDDEGALVTFALEGVSIAGFEPGLYPEVSATGFDITVDGGPDAGSMSIGEIVFKGFDFTAQLDLLDSLPENLDQSWVEENARALIPAFHGFSMADVAMDVPNPDLDGERITGSLGSFDLSLSNYINGIPADIATSAANLVIDVPADSQDESLQSLIAAGIERLDLGYDLTLRWDESSERIDIENLSLEGANLGSIAASATLANAVAGLFSTDVNEAAVAGMGLTVTQLQLAVTDNGLVDTIMTIAGAEQGATAQQMRPALAGVAEGMALGLLGGTEQAMAVGRALGEFLRGGSQLNVTVTTNDPNGIGLPQFMAAEEDPTVLLNQVTIEATSN